MDMTTGANNRLQGSDAGTPFGPVQAQEFMPICE